MEDTLEQEAQSIEHLLKGKSVSRIYRHRAQEICVEFTDGTRFFIESQSSGALEFSITGGSGE